MNRDLDRFIAEKVLGLKVYTPENYGRFSYEPKYVETDGNIHRELRKYTFNTDLALEALKKSSISKDRSAIEISESPDRYLFLFGYDSYTHTYSNIVENESLATAICEAIFFAIEGTTWNEN